MCPKESICLKHVDPMRRSFCVFKACLLEDTNTQKCPCMFQLGPNGYAFSINANGYIVFHPNLKAKVCHCVQGKQAAMFIANFVIVFVCTHFSCELLIKYYSTLFIVYSFKG